MYVFEVADYKFSVRIHEFKMADSIWLPRCYKISIKLLVVTTEYFFIHAKKQLVTENNDGVKNQKEKRKFIAKKWNFG